jgi:hypothetical protein
LCFGARWRRPFDVRMVVDNLNVLRDLRRVGFVLHFCVILRRQRFGAAGLQFLKGLQRPFEGAAEAVLDPVQQGDGGAVAQRLPCSGRGLRLLVGEQGARRSFVRSMSSLIRSASRFQRRRWRAS